MNKRNRNIQQIQINWMKKLAKQIISDKRDLWLTIPVVYGWYIEWCITPRMAAYKLLTKKPSEIYKVARFIAHGEERGMPNTHGTLFSVKFPIVTFGRTGWVKPGDHKRLLENYNTAMFLLIN